MVIVQPWLGGRPTCVISFNSHSSTSFSWHLGETISEKLEKICFLGSRGFIAVDFLNTHPVLFQPPGCLNGPVSLGHPLFPSSDNLPCLLMGLEGRNGLICITVFRTHSYLGRNLNYRMGIKDVRKNPTEGNICNYGSAYFSAYPCLH